jgi:transitional endoplasmic reticulum ATPase
MLDELLEALRHSPDNAPLRAHVAGLLLDRGQAQDAERIVREGLALTPESERLKLILARTFFQQGKHSQAMVIVEELVRRPGAAADAFLLFARLCAGAGDSVRGAPAYRRAVELNPALADEALAEQLNVRAVVPDSASLDEDEEIPFGDDDDAEPGDPRLAVTREDRAGSARIDLERPTISFINVGGMEAVKDEIRMKVIHPLTHADLYKAYGKPIGGGILMYGPPGCGKTHLARATAGEVKAGFISVGLHDVLDMWIGSSEHRLHQIFEQARRHKPCVLFFDEVDALGASRADLRHSAGRQLINQFLSELDGVDASNEGVLILAATNAPWHLDSAFRRPGRFDRVLFVPPPDAPARASILRVMLQGKPVKDIDHDAVAKKAENFSGADLKAVVDVAIEAKLREAMARGVPTPLTTKDLLAATRTLKPTTAEWFATARNYALYANQGGQYDDIMTYLERR